MDHRSIHRPSQRASLVETLIVVGIVCISGGIVLAILVRSVRDDLTGDARAFGQSLGLEVRVATCTQTDSDGDGYVSCTLGVQRPTGLEVMPVECARRHLAQASGCRMQRPGLAGGLR